MPKVGGSGMAIIDEQGGGPCWGPDGLKIDLEKRVARSRLGSYYAKLPNGDRTLFSDKEGQTARLTAVRVYVGLGETEKAASYKPVSCAAVLSRDEPARSVSLSAVRAAVAAWRAGIDSRARLIYDGRSFFSYTKAAMASFSSRAACFLAGGQDSIVGLVLARDDAAEAAVQQGQLREQREAGEARRQRARQVVHVEREVGHAGEAAERNRHRARVLGVAKPENGQAGEAAQARRQLSAQRIVPDLQVNQLRQGATEAVRDGAA